MTAGNTIFIDRLKDVIDGERVVLSIESGRANALVPIRAELMFDRATVHPCKPAHIDFESGDSELTLMGIDRVRANKDGTYYVFCGEGTYFGCRFRIRKA